MSDSRVSITAVRCGNAAGANGPVVFLASGQNVNRTFSDYRPQKSMVYQKVPQSSQIAVLIWMTKLGSLCVKAMAPGIRAMPVIKDHPEWWACLTFDGFKSHVNVNDALQDFADVIINNIWSSNLSTKFYSIKFG